MEKPKTSFPKWLLTILIVVGGIVFLTIVSVILMFTPLSPNYRQSLDDASGGFIPGVGTPSSEGRDITDKDVTVYPPEQPDIAPSDSKERKIIKSATVYSVVESLKNAKEETEKLIALYDGYVIASTESDTTDQESLDITVRVPSDKFEAFIDDIEKFGRVTYKTTKGDDVTDEYVDLESKLRNLEASEKQYLKIMEKATKVEEILQVQQYLSSVRSEIEVIKGRMQFIDKSAELSTIQISYSLEERSKDVISDEWDPQGTVRNALKALVGISQSLADVVIYLIVLSPVVLVPGLIIYVIKRSLDAKKMAKK